MRTEIPVATHVKHLTSIVNTALMQSRATLLEVQSRAQNFHFLSTSLPWMNLIFFLALNWSQALLLPCVMATTVFNLGGTLVGTYADCSAFL